MSAPDWSPVERVSYQAPEWAPVEKVQVQPDAKVWAPVEPVVAPADDGPGVVRGAVNAFARGMWNLPETVNEYRAGGKAQEARALREDAAAQEAFAEKGFMTGDNRAAAKVKRERAAALEAEAAAMVGKSATARALSEEFFPKTAADKAVEEAKGALPTLAAMAQNPSAILNQTAEGAPQLAAAMGVGVATKNPVLAAAAGGVVMGGDAYAQTRAGVIRAELVNRGIDPADTAAVTALMQDTAFLDEMDRRAAIAGAGGAVVGAVLPVSNMAGAAAERAVAGAAKEVAKVGAREVTSAAAPSAARSVAAQAAGVVADAGVQGAVGAVADAGEQLAMDGTVDAGQTVRRAVSDAATGAAFRVAHGTGAEVDGVRADLAARDARGAAVAGEFAARHGTSLTAREWSGPQANVGELAAQVAAEAKTRMPEKVTLREKPPEAPAKAPDLDPSKPFTLEPGEPLAPPVPSDFHVLSADDEALAATMREHGIRESAVGLAEASSLKPLDKPHLSVDEWRSTLNKRELADDGSVAWDKIRDARKLEHAQRIPELEAQANAEVERRWLSDEWKSVADDAGFTLRDLLAGGDVALPAGVDAARLTRAERSGKLGSELHALHKNLGNQGAWMNWVDARKSPSLDHTLEQLHEHGFRQIQDIPELLDALDKTVRGKPVYPSERPRAWALAAERSPVGPEFAIEEARGYSPPERLALDPAKPLGERMRAAVNKGAGGLVAVAKSSLLTRGDLPQGAYFAKEAMHGRMNLAAKRVEWATDALAKAMRDADKGKRHFGFTADELRPVNAALAGDRAALDALPEGVRVAVGDMRLMLDGLSAQLIEAGAIPEKMVATVDGNISSYLHRSYKHFDDRGWADSVPEAHKRRVISLFMEQVPELTPEEARGMVANLLHREDGPVAALSKLGKREQSILMQKGDIHPAIRALWGEYEDPFVNFTRSVHKMTSLLEAARFQREVEAMGRGVFLFDKPTVGADGREFVAQVGGAERGAFKALEDMKRASANIDPQAQADMGGAAPEATQAELGRGLGPLAKYYTTPEIAAVLRNLEDATAETNKVNKVLLAASGLSQYAKTVLSPVTHIRNVTANPAFLLAQGNWGLGAASEGFQAFREQAMGKGSKEFRGRFERYVELGLVGDSLSSGLMREMLQRSGAMDEGALLGWARKPIEVANRFYGAEDDMFKVIAFENELAKYRRALPDKPVAEVEAMAAEIVKNTLPTFSRVNKVVRAVRRQAYFGNFVAFPAEVMRVSWNTLEIGARELRTPELRAIGARRLASFMAVVGSSFVLEEVSRMLLGWNKDKQGAMREMLAVFMRNSPVWWLPENEKGEARAISLDGVNPFAVLQKPIKAAFRSYLDGANDETALRAFAESASQMVDPFTGEKMLFSRIIDAARNRDNLTNRDLWNDTDPTLTKVRKGGAHVAAAMMPGAVDTAGRIYKGAVKEVEDNGRTYTLRDEVVAAMSGQRVTTVDTRKAVEQRFREFATREGEASAPMRDAVRAMKNKGTEGTGERLLKSWHDTQERRFAEYVSMRRVYEAGHVVGVPGNAMVGAMKEARMSAAESGAIRANRFMPNMPNPEDVPHILAAPGGAEALRAMQAEAGRYFGKPLTTK